MQVYVGTYGKYNNGDLTGKWLNVEDYSDKEEFLAACTELHKDEAHPELMFQDHEDIPDTYIYESSIKNELWDDYIPLTDDEREVVNAYWDQVGGDDSIDYIQEAFQGKFDDEEDYVIDFIEQTGDTKSMGWLSNYIDYEAIARDWRLSGDVTFAHYEGKVYVFSNH